MKNGYYKSSDGHQGWRVNGRLHREDGPAAIAPDGTKEWYQNDKLHREDGPAYIGANGTQEWWVNGKNITNEVNQWFEECNLTYDTMEFEDKMALKFYIRGLST